jgi:hypothetical protein
LRALSLIAITRDLALDGGGVHIHPLLVNDEVRITMPRVTSNEKCNDSYLQFCDLVALAEEYFKDKNLPAAVGLAQIAARYMFPGNGLFVSTRLERLLLEIGKQIPTDLPRGARNNGNCSRNVLHVLTHARPIGGDSRFAWRWIQRDGSSCHSVAITAQSDVSHLYPEVPKDMSEAAIASGGFVRTITAPNSNPLEQARELRQLCQGMDMVVLHLFPYDVIPALALAAGCDTVKTLFVHHADHTFWVGASVAHSIVHLRRQSAQFLRSRRGLDPEQSSLLPIPLTYTPPRVTRNEAKRALGYEPDVVLLLTIATPFKYSAPRQIGFLDLIIPVLHKLPQAVLVAVGPEPQRSWKSAQIKTNGRVIALGHRWDTDIFYAAADIYLDSVPFSSITSLLEAGSYGVPLLGLKPANPELELLGPGAAGLEEAMELANDITSYRSLLTRLVSDTDFRHRSGLRIQERILSLHTGRGWVDALQEVYAKVEHAPDRRCLIAKEDAFAIDELNMALIQLYSSVPFSVRRLIREYICAFPYSSRLLITLRLYLIGFDLCLLNLLPPPTDVFVHRTGRWLKRRMERFMAN